nr:MAG TPA: hypothetical protein [Caudoviricetes sp.]
MERLTLDDMIKALKCVASQDTIGDCYADHENFMHMNDGEYKRIVCRAGEDLRDPISDKEAVGCPYHQNTYGCCFEDGELHWLKDVAELLEELKSYKEAEEHGLLMKLPVPLGTTVYTLSTIFDCIYDYDCKSYQKWKCKEDIPCEYEKRSYHIKETEFGFVMAHSIGETVFLAREEAEKKLEEMKNE